MSLFVTLRLELPVLETALECASDVEVTIEDQTRTRDGAVDLTVWATGGDREAFETGLEDDGTVARWIRMGEADSRTLYRTRLTERASSAVDYEDWTDGEAVFVSSTRTIDGWNVQAFVNDRSVLQEFAKGCEANGVSYDLLRVSEVDRIEDARRFGLTDLQSETLLTAYEEGFYTVPRTVTLEELAEPLDVSHQALSERLRRGVDTLITNTIADRRDAEPVRATADRASETSVRAQAVTLDPMTATEQ